MPRRAQDRGSTLVIALILLAVLSVIGGAAVCSPPRSARTPRRRRG